jgi:hypothetical protein
MSSPDYPAGDDPMYRDPARANYLLAAIVVFVTVAAYLLLLGWHELQEYQTWKVWGFVGVLTVLAGCNGWRGYARAGAVLQTVVVTVFWSVDAATDPGVEEPSLWPAGAVFIAIGTILGALAVGGCAALLRRLLIDRNP